MTNSITRNVVFLVLGSLFAIGCTREYRLENVHDISIDEKFEDDVNLKVSTIPVFNHTLGIYDYKLYLKEAVEKQFNHSLQNFFKGGVASPPAQTNIIITAIDTSIFPIASLIIDIRLFFKVEIYDHEMSKQKTMMIYGFGSDPDGNRALEKAVSNAVYQMIPSLEEMFIRK